MMLARLWRWLRRQFVTPDPAPQYSNLDHLDGLGEKPRD